MLHDCRLSRFSIAFSLMLVSFCHSHSLHAQTTDAEQRLDEIRAKMMEERAKLKTGSFKAVGTETSYWAERDETITIAIQSHDTFDRPGNRERYDFFSRVKLTTIPAMQQTQQNLDTMREHAFKTKKRIPDVKCQMVRCPDYMTSWSGHGTPGVTQLAITNLSLRDPAAKPGVPRVGPLDPSSVSFFDNFHYHHGMTLEEIWEKLISQTENVEFHTTAKGLYEVTFQQQHITRKVYIDLSNGYTVRRIEVYGSDDEGKLLEEPSIIGTASWKRLNEVWVPKEYSVRFDHQDGDYKKSEFKFYWETINPDPETFDDDLFTFNSFDGLWEGISLVDMRGEIPIYMGRVNSEGEIIYGSLNGGDLEP